MKKILLLLFIFAFGYNAMAQLPINIGVHGGITSNRIKVKDIPSAIGSRAHTGYLFGAFARLNLGKIYIEPSLNYNHKESIIETKSLSQGANNGDITLKVNSFDIPLMLGFEVLDLSILKLRTYLGPVMSFPSRKGGSELGIEKTRTTNWHGKLGVGVDVWKLTFDIDYEKAFKDLGHDLKAPRSFNFVLGIKII